ncbi:immunoglobulin domain-containing protein [Spirosoma rhododendri]|uniref:Ig-like domain-containing protein n=1 Tax=Spirosoma rhododendri TaxID=2728024 RepID=A0A7L5DQC0_9BACT|nr:hypothetical protein [Spirosoma rhododendri]QJD80335.1 hypothetical protein HH216_19320 [Spirosoma rhododendri]
MSLSLRLFRCVVALLFLCAGVAQAQVTVSNVTPSTVCAGGNVSFSYTNALGLFSQTSINLVGPSTNTTTQLLATITAGSTSGTVSVTIPRNKAGGSYTIQVLNQSNGGSATTQPFTVVALPAAPTTSNVTYCQNATPTSLTASGQNLKWYTAASGGAASTSITPSTATPGATTYYVSQTNSSGCESDRAPLTVTVNALPNAPTTTNVSYCQNATPTSLTATGQNLKWYTSSSGGRPPRRLHPRQVRPVRRPITSHRPTPTAAKVPVAR